MFKHETFPNAPITEALIDVRVTFERAVKLDQLEKLSEQLSKRFPIKETQIAHEYALKVQDAAGGVESPAYAFRRDWGPQLGKRTLPALVGCHLRSEDM